MQLKLSAMNKMHPALPHKVYILELSTIFVSDINQQTFLQNSALAS